MAEKKPHIRPPQDMASPMVQVSEGCTHGACRFCSIYQGEAFRALPMDEVTREIDAIAKSATALTSRIYLTGGNPYSLPTEQLEKVFDEIEARIPTVRSYGGFCRIMDVAAKTDDELKRLAERGVDDIAIGAESGCDDTLAFMRKGHAASDVMEQGRRLHEAGIGFTFYYLAGLAGKGNGQRNAEESARVFSAAAPKRVLILTLSPTKTWPLAADIASGAWEPSDEVEAVREIRTFVAGLDCHTNVNSSHDTDIIKFEGMVPDSQSKMLELLDNGIKTMNESASQKIREFIHGAPWKTEQREDRN